MNWAVAPADDRVLAYLINIYPAPSHSFIRREIAALESNGWRVHRFSHRRSGVAEPDPSDQAERLRTVFLLDAGACSMLGSVSMAIAARPAAAIAAFGRTLRMAWHGDKRFIAHVGYFVLACVLSRRLKGLGCRYVHAHFGTNPAAVALLARRLCGSSYSVTFHGPHEFVLPDRLNLGDKIAEAAFVAVVSQAGEQAIRNRYPQHAAKVRLVRCGLDAIWFDDAPTPVPEARCLLFVGRLESQKNPVLLIDAAKRLYERGVRFQLTIIGDGSLRPDTERRIEESRVSHCVHLLGWTSQDQVRRHLLASRALVLSSDDEGLPVAIMEAFATGRPAIATDVGGVRELVETGVTGWLVPRGDVKALAYAMERCLAASAPSLQVLADRAWRRAQAYDVRESAKALSAAFIAAR